MGLSRERTYLYRIAKVDGWSASKNGSEWPWELWAPGQVGRLPEIGPFDVNEGLKRLLRGDRCYTVCLDGRLAHYSWVQRSGSHPILEAGTSVPVIAGGFWIYHCMTAAWARGRGIYPSTLIRIVRDHFDAGCSTAWIYTARENIASQRGILRAGFGMVATLDALRVGGRYYPLGRTDQDR
jgi:RimJ/RimL family protein N-acetyltransferase